MVNLPSGPQNPGALGTPNARSLPSSSGAPTVPQGAPTGTLSGLGLCCACPFSGRVNTNGSGTYYTAGYPHSNVLTNAAGLSVVRTQTGGTVEIAKTFSLTYANGATAANDAANITSAIATGTSDWNTGASGYKVEITQPGCQTQQLSIRFKSTVVASNADVVITVDGTPNTSLRSFVMGGTAMTFYTAPSNASWVMAHELGHCFGQPDEYTEITGNTIVVGPPPSAQQSLAVPNATPQMTYHGTGTQGGNVVVTLTHNPGFQPPPGATSYDFWFDQSVIMGEYGSYTFPPRNFFWIAIEVERILNTHLGGCTVRIV